MGLTWRLAKTPSVWLSVSKEIEINFRGFCQCCEKRTKKANREKTGNRAHNLELRLGKN